MGRHKGSLNRIARKKTCNVCNVDLVVGENTNKGYAKCKSCKSEYNKQWRKDNPELYTKLNRGQQTKEGTGVYQVMLGSICLYVGEGQIYGRKNKHLKCKDKNSSSVYTYCLKHNINRKLLSFNVLEYEDNKTRMEQLEDWYITFLTPVINPEPTLGLYV